MTSYVEMSLDDIIQKNRRDTRNRSKIKKNIPFQKQNPKVIDARNKIISNKRTKITDAREKLAELAKLKDARLKLQQMREKRLAMSKAKEGKNYHGHEMFKQPLYRKDRVFIDSTRQVTSQPISNLTSNKHVTRSHNFNHNNNRFTANRTFGSRSIVNTYSLKPIVRTVENVIEVIDDPMDGEYVARKSSSSVMNRKASLQLKIIAHNNDIHENKSVQRVIPDKEQSPPKPPSILKKRPMAALRNDKKDDKVEKPVLEYRIIVSNLRNTVTGGDIEELFGDVGGMQESRLVRPGTAEVLYKSLEDAQKAVDLYHNRQLDGQPMNCLLVTPRSTSTASRCSSKPALYSTNSNVEPDISTFHKVLFSNL